MTKRTTDEWEALLDGTTPGPWARSESAWEPHDVRTADQERWVAMTKDGDDGVDKDALADTHLIAAAPEAVAELVRLRRALEQQLAYITDELEAEGVETHDDIDGTWPSMQRYGELSEMIDQRDFLTRILEGGNDERPADDAGAGSC